MRDKEAHAKLAEGFVFALAAAIASRIMVYAVGYTAHWVLSDERTAVGVFCRWDCDWFATVMRDGYPATPAVTLAGQVDWGYMPLLPLLARLPSVLAPISPEFALLITSNVAFLLAALVTYYYGREQFGEAFARALVLVMCFNPYSVYFSAGYSEPLFLLMTALSLLLWRRERFLLAGLAAAAASATRIVGVFLVLPLTISALQDGMLSGLSKLRERDLRMLNGILLAPAGFALFTSFLYFRIGDVLAAFHAMAVGGSRVPGNPVRVLLRAWNTADSMERYFAAIISVGLVLAVYLAIRKRLGDAAFMAAGILVPLSTMTASMPRYIFGLLPTYVALTLVSRDLQLPTLPVVAILAALSVIVVVIWIAGLGVLI